MDKYHSFYLTEPINKKKAVLLNDWNKECMGYRFIFDDHEKPLYVITKRYVDESEVGSNKDKLGCFSWKSFLSKPSGIAYKVNLGYVD